MYQIVHPLDSYIESFNPYTHLKMQFRDCVECEQEVLADELDTRHVCYDCRNKDFY